jgi:hypothetical protein
MSDKTILRSFGPSAGALPAPSTTAAGRGSSGSLTYLHNYIYYTTKKKYYETGRNAAFCQYPKRGRRGLPTAVRLMMSEGL